MSQLSEQLDALVRQIENYEQNQKSLDAAVYLADLSNLIYNFELIQHHEERKKEVDQRLYHHICSHELETSFLRFVTLHLLSIAFEFYGNRSGEHDQAYTEARQARRDATNEAAFLQAVLLPKLLDSVNLDVPIDLRFQFLCKVAKLQNDGKDTPIFDDFTPVPQITRMTKEMFALGLTRRWMEHDKANLSQDGRYIENKLFHNKTFQQVARFDQVMGQILGARCLNYTVRPPWYRRLGRALAIFLQKLWASLLNLPYVFGRARPGIYLALGLAAFLLAVVTTLVVWSREDAEWLRLHRAFSDRRTVQEPHGTP